MLPEFYHGADISSDQTQGYSNTRTNVCKFSILENHKVMFRAELFQTLDDLGSEVLEDIDMGLDYI